MGLARINQLIEAFVYCVLGSQVALRSSILGSGGSAKDVQTKFLKLVDDSIRLSDLATSVTNYQNAVYDAQMVINTGSVIGYNNQLKQAMPGMKLGVNDEVNTSTKKAALKLMAGGPTKINPPNSHPSNPIHKEATQEKGPETEEQTPQKKEAATEEQTPDEPIPNAGGSTETHENNKAAVAAVGAAALIYTFMR